MSTGTAVGTAPRSWLQQNVRAIGLVAGLLVVLVVLAVLTVGGKAGLLDPDAYSPDGAHAARVLLEDRGVQVSVVRDLPATQAAAGEATTVFLPFPELLSDQELALLAELPGEVVVAGGGPRAAAVVVPGAEAVEPVDVDEREARCDFEPARNAGTADVGGTTYEGPGTSCYDDALLAGPAQRRVLVGDAAFMTNELLDERGNAALMLGLLGRSSTLLWLLPDLSRPELGTRPVQDPSELLPDWVASVQLQLLVALAVLALWRARRLGRAVPEPLPVVVPAAETTEGRGRLYHAAAARGTAAEALRAAARQQLAVRLGAGRATGRDALVAKAAERAGRPDVEVHALLYGPQPGDDAALVRLADDLDALVRSALEVPRS